MALSQMTWELVQYSYQQTGTSQVKIENLYELQTSRSKPASNADADRWVGWSIHVHVRFYIANL